MASRLSIIIAKKARSKAEVDFATWLMMAKLGRFDDLPANAQAFLTNYRARFARSTVPISMKWEAQAPRPNRKLAIQSPTKMS